jgi:hypothetical protein
MSVFCLEGGRDGLAGQILNYMKCTYMCCASDQFLPQINATNRM